MPDISNRFPVTALLDDFNRADESPIGGNWTTPIVPGNASAAISGNQVITNNTPPAAPSAYWNPRTFGPDCEVWMRIAADFETSEELILWARLTPGTGHEGYECAVNQDGTIYLGKRVAGVWNDSGLYSYVSPAVGDYLGLRCVGSTIEAWYRPVGTGVWERKTVWTDTTFPDAGRIGFTINTQDFDTAADDFGGGNVSPYAAEVLADGPVAYYRMDESSGLIQDSSGNANHATSTVGLGSAVYQESGAITSEPSSKSIKVSGSEPEGYAWLVPDHATLDLGDVFTLECWVKRLGISSSYLQQFINKHTNGYGFGITTGNLLELRKVDVAVIVESTTGITDTAGFHHCVATKNGATSKLYLDGVDVTGSVSNQTIADNTSELRIGAHYGGGYMFQGWMDEVAIYPTALSAARIRAHYRAGKYYRPSTNIVIR